MARVKSGDGAGGQSADRGHVQCAQGCFAEGSLAVLKESLIASSRECSVG